MDRNGHPDLTYATPMPRTTGLEQHHIDGTITVTEISEDALDQIEGRPVVVYGPRGCGKTRNAERLRDTLGCRYIIDPARLERPCDLVKGGLHLTNVDLSAFPNFFGARVLSFEKAMALVPDAEPERGVERDLNALARDIHAQNVAVGWWDTWLGKKIARHATAMMLSISELAEAMEGDRKNLMDDHLPHRRMWDVELADAAIRLLDLAGAYETDLTRTSQEAVEFAAELIGLAPPEQLFCVIQASLVFSTEETQVNVMLAGVLGIARVHEIDLFPIIAEKRAYNAKRADHKLENRAAANGKAY